MSAKRKKDDTRRRRGSGSAWKCRGEWYGRWRINGRDITRKAGPEESDAKALLRDVERLHVRGGLSIEDAVARVCGTSRRGGSLTFREALDLYLDARDKAEDLKASTRDRNRGRSGAIREAPWSAKPAQDIGRKEVRAWVARRAAGRVSGKSLVNDLVLASTVWKWLDDEQMIDPDLENPFLRARPRRFHQMKRRPLDEPEVRALAEGFRTKAPDAYPLFLATLFSGWRVGELVGLKEADLDLGDRPSMTIDGRKEKTGKTKTAYLGEPLVSILRAERKDRPRLPTALVFTDRRGRPWTPWTRADRMGAALKAVSEKTIPAWKRVKDDDYLGIDWHTLRHSVRSMLSSRGHRPAVIGELLGQANVATERRYDHGYQREALAVAADVAAMLSETLSKSAAQGGA